MTEQPRLHHLLDRMLRGALLPAEREQLAGLVGDVEKDRDAARDRLDYHEQTMLPDLRRRTESDAAAIKRWRDRANQAEADLAEVTQARQHGAFTFCEQQVGHVTIAAFARKISEKRAALGQREEAVRYANKQRRRAEQAEAAIERVREWADDQLRYNDRTELLYVLDHQPPADTDREPPVHLAKGTNAEDCPACRGTNPDYPFLCPGPTAA